MVSGRHSIDKQGRRVEGYTVHSMHKLGQLLPLSVTYLLSHLQTSIVALSFYTTGVPSRTALIRGSALGPCLSFRPRNERSQDPPFSFWKCYFSLS